MSGIREDRLWFCRPPHEILRVAFGAEIPEALAQQFWDKWVGRDGGDLSAFFEICGLMFETRPDEVVPAIKRLLQVSKVRVAEIRAGIKAHSVAARERLVDAMA